MFCQSQITMKSETLRPAKGYFEENNKEDVAEREKMGYDMMKEEMSSVANNG
ncbi:hypothetical protein NDK47_22955 [Brevibacillus ruminantium]|uniref:Uncharacterized protein n=1 Tax=Brevibacillus ruminantium TaxID=2950604 RepID=A0ABY4WD13_9BACL|nr:hypothetical protein [Brevibacillus ruminantium]USG64953.1 hypothetical protein NDK47_22955 [Brevibacillus ruminantium]